MEKQQICVRAQQGMRQNIQALHAFLPDLTRVLYIGSSTLPGTMKHYLTNFATPETLQQRRLLLDVMKLCIREQMMSEMFPCDVVYIDLFVQLDDDNVQDKWGHLKPEALIGRFFAQQADLAVACVVPLPTGKLAMDTELAKSLL